MELLEEVKQAKEAFRQRTPALLILKLPWS